MTYILMNVLKRPVDIGPVLDVIRAEVPRPAAGDAYNGGFGGIRFRDGRCPLGLLPGADHLPVCPEMVPGWGFSDDQVLGFACWVDSFESPAEAIRAVWGEEGRCTSS